MTEQYETISKFDRAHGGLQDVAMFTKASTVKYHQPLTGKTETFIIQTARHEDGDYIFIECIDEAGVVRIVLPPKVAKLIPSQSNSLTTRRRRKAGKIEADRRKAEGILPGFMLKKKEA